MSSNIRLGPGVTTLHEQMYQLLRDGKIGMWKEEKGQNWEKRGIRLGLRVPNRPRVPTYIGHCLISAPILEGMGEAENSRIYISCLTS
jgi:hypothetical protein